MYRYRHEFYCIILMLYKFVLLLTDDREWVIRKTANYVFKPMKLKGKSL